MATDMKRGCLGRDGDSSDEVAHAEALFDQGFQGAQKHELEPAERVEFLAKCARAPHRQSCPEGRTTGHGFVQLYTCAVVSMLEKQEDR